MVTAVAHESCVPYIYLASGSLTEVNKKNSWLLRGGEKDVGRTEAEMVKGTRRCRCQVVGLVAQNLAAVRERKSLEHGV